MNYIMTVINPDALKKLSDICAQLEIPMSVALHGRGTAIESADASLLIFRALRFTESIV